MFAMTSAFSWQNSISLCPASSRTLTNLPVTPGVSWLPTFAFQSPIMKRTSFFLGVSSKGLVGLHRTIQLQVLQHYWLGHRLGLPWHWMVCLGNEQRSIYIFYVQNLFVLLVIEPLEIIFTNSWRPTFTDFVVYCAIWSWSSNILAPWYKEPAH